MSEQPCEQHVVQFSGGVASAYAAKRVIDRYGRDSVTLLFADTKAEHPDLYRFNQEVSAYLGIPLTILCEGRTPWDVFFDKQFLGNTRIDPCSLVLKRDLLWGWIERNAPKDARVYVGIDWSEEHRLDRLRTYRPTFSIDSPLLWPPMPDKIDMLKEVTRKWKVKPCVMYEEGFAHANCHGACVKAGQAQWRLLLHLYPDQYAYHEKREQELREYLGKDVAILRDRRGGKTRPLTLKEFRERIEGGGEHDRHDYGGCGCAIE